MKVDKKTIKEMDKKLIFLKIEQITKEDGKTIKEMDKVKLSGEMEQIIKINKKIEIKTAKGIINGPVE